MKNMLILSLGAALASSGAVGQTPDAAVWRSRGPGIADALSSIPQFIQQDMGRNRDRDRMSPGSHMNRDEDDDRDEPGGGGRAGAAHGAPAGPLAQGHPGMWSSMGGMMGLGGARFQRRKGDAAIDVRCPSVISLNECVDAIGRMLDRLGAMGSGGPPAQH